MVKTIRKVIAIMSTLVLLIPACSFGTDSVQSSDEDHDNRVTGEVSVKYNPSVSDKGENTIVGCFSDDFFSENNTVYSKSLAEFSLLTTMAGMTKKASLASETGTVEGRDGYIYDLLVNKLKFESYQSEKYDTTLENDDDTVGYAFACKNIDGTNVMAIVIRSGGYGKEWGSNTRVGCSAASSQHEGFEKAAECVLTDVEAYASEYEVDKIWLCGYSRGGAVSNILGKRIQDKNVIPEENLYCYTFESPMTTRQTENTRGIFNVLSTSDSIPQILLKQWGFTRYGTNVYIYSSNSTKAFRSCCEKVEDTFNDITGKNYKVNNIITNETFCEVTYAMLGNIEQYDTLQPKLEKALEYYMGNGESNLSGSYSDDGAVDAMECIGITAYCNKIWDNTYYKLKTIFQQHWPEATYAWLKEGNTGQENSTRIVSLMGHKGTKPTEKFYASVKDSNGDTVAVVDEGCTENNPGVSKDAALDEGQSENGDIRILIPEDEKYAIEIKACEDMELDYSIREYEGEGELVRTVSYYDIALKEGDTIKGSLDEGTENDPADYNLQTDDGKILTPAVEGENRSITGKFLTKVEAHDATCTTDGNDAYWYSSGSGRYYSNAEGTNEISKDSWIVKASGHSYKIVSAGNGCSYKKCSRCGQRKDFVAPSYVKSFKVSKGKKCFTAKWKKQSKSNMKKFSGYQIRYSKYSNMSGAKYKNIGKSKKSVKIKGLGKKVRYYVQLRTYTGEFYSGWSTKSVVTK